MRHHCAKDQVQKVGLAGLGLKGQASTSVSHGPAWVSCWLWPFAVGVSGSPPTGAAAALPPPPSMLLSFPVFILVKSDRNS